MRYIILTLVFISNFGLKGQAPIKVIDTDFSKGRLANTQIIEIADLEKFHGHICDGLVIGYIGLREALYKLFPDSIIDRTSLRIVSKPSPCLTDVAIYLTGGRYQYNSFYTKDSLDYMFIVGNKDSSSFYGVKLKPGILPASIDSLSKLAVQKRLTGCALDELERQESEFYQLVIRMNPFDVFIIEELESFDWQPILNYNYIKTDIINKNARECDD
jgi:formylmethanofuran dehydrogenase subunit E